MENNIQYFIMAAQKSKQWSTTTNCSTMKTIIREAAKLLYKYDGITPTKQEKQEAAKEHAKYILGCVEKKQKHYDTGNY